jgi:aldose 1-epimerase
VIELSSEALRVRLDPKMGTAFSRVDIVGPPQPSGERWWALMRPATEPLLRPYYAASYLMAPWPNRVRAARFVWKGKEVRLTPDFEDGTAIHGLVKDRPFTLLDRTPESARLERVLSPQGGWPWPARVVARYSVEGAVLRATLRIENLGGGDDRPMPVGAGFHPHFQRRLWAQADSLRVRVAARGRYAMTHCLPEAPAADDDLCARLREGLIAGDEPLDDLFALSSPAAGLGVPSRLPAEHPDRWHTPMTLDWPGAGVRVVTRCTSEFAHGVVWAPRRLENPARTEEFVAVEPQTAATDAFNLDEKRGLAGKPGPREFGTLELRAGESIDLAVEWHVTDLKGKAWSPARA